MKLWVMSDLHCEFHGDSGERFFAGLPDVDYDVAALAGDLCDFASIPRTYRLIAQRFKRAILVDGNHHAYSRGMHSIAETEFRSREEAAKYPNLSFLERDTVTIDGQRFVGTTLWFPYNAREPIGNEWCMNDFDQIRNLHEDVGEWNRLSVRYLEETIEPGDVVVTHHLPSQRCVHPRYAKSSLNAYFVCDVEHVMRVNRPAAWIYGHTHSAAEDWVGDTLMVANPHGYPGENPMFNPGLVIELPGPPVANAARS
jgi:predicted phosphodiesterase